MLMADADGVRLQGVPGAWWTHDPERLAALVAAFGDRSVWHAEESVLGVPDGHGLLPVSLLPAERTRTACRGADGEPLRLPGSVGPR